ncbi:MAG: M3 family oligoendopeptidase [Nanoarchaeota archaeon]|nr:M3 family oligoendopeptidase [Nanoarchaeota archaeon]MBU4242605.1 M3 family oligoendopeptidase [Nanoarchaeota archaeon]MBU4353058.1 M3 family oligoendopeptidase [Nanoarchaeota archaeon]MBU4457066.1 M3 family oligoendopeptidase [Nanoarchaeota archaeon]MCG2719517.1 M3 family oligoendopeptidase [Nanoarchaeota archaeon]
MEKLIWNLNDVLKVDDFDALYAKVEQDIEKLDIFYEKLSPDMSIEDFQDYVEFDEQLGEDYNRLDGLPHLALATNIEDNTAKKLFGRFQDIKIKYSEKNTKINLWLQGKEVDEKPVLDDENANRLFSSIPNLEYVLQDMRKQAKYSLTEPEEKMVTAKDANLKSPLLELRSEITTEFKYVFRPKGAKEEQIIDNQSDMNKYFFSQNPDEREATYVALLSKFKDNVSKLFWIYQAVVKDWIHSAEKRGYNSSISIRNVDNGLPDKAVETLLEVCAENVGIYQDYFRFKAKELGIEKLRRFDIYAPLKIKSEEDIPFEEGKKIVFETFKLISKNFAEKAQQVLDEQHVDSHPNPKKKSGAFCSTISSKITPYVMLNYTNTANDVATLAHELGHAVHSLLSNHLPSSAQDSSLPLAETASTFAEMVVFEKLFEKADEQTKKAMLSDKLADSYKSIMRQTYFVNFEIRAHEAIKKGVNAEELSDIYFETLKEQFGDSLDIDPLFKYEWSMIPHLVRTPFYCYAYPFGDLLSLALYGKYKEEGQSFVQKIENILAVGGSKSPEDTLKEVNIDINSKDFWQGSFNVIKGWQEQLNSFQ